MISAAATPSNALDRIDFGNSTSEAVHSFEPNYTAKQMPISGTGALGQTYREAFGNSMTSPTGSVALIFTMTVDPARQNYLTVRVWGSDIPGGQMYLLNAPTTYEAIEQDGGNPPFPGRFCYYTIPIPLTWTTGKTSAQITIWFAHYFDRYFGTGTNYMSDGELATPVYSAFTHTDPYFVADSNDPTGTQPTQTATPTLAPLNIATAVGTTTTPGFLLNERKSVFGTTGELATVIARQAIVLDSNGTWSAPSGAPQEVAGLDLFTALTGWIAANPGATADTWRNRIANQKAGPGYTAFPDELLSVLTTAYITPKITDSTGTVVTATGYDDYHDATLIPRIVAAMDGASYEQDSDGGFIQQGSEWTGLTSAARTTGAFIGATSREPTVHGGGDLQGIDTYALGWCMINLLNDPAGSAAFQSYLAQSYDADLDGGSVLRATAYERMLYNAVNWYSYGTGGTESQNMFQMVAMYASSIALQKLQALYPNSTYVVNPANYPTGNWLQSTFTPLQAAKMVMGLIPDTLRNDYQAGYTNYGMSIAGLGEAGGVLSGGVDGGGYGQMLPWISPRIAWLSTFDPSASGSDVAAFQTKARAAINAYDQFIYPQESVVVNSTGVVTSDIPTMATENFITYRNVENPNWNAGTYNFNPQYTASDPAGRMNSPYALRGAYLQTQYGQSPQIADSVNASLNYLKDLAPYESTVRGLINVTPSTLTPLPGEPGQGEYTWCDMQIGAIGFYHNGERFFMNTNWRNSYFNNGNYSQTGNVARIDDITGNILHAAWIYMPAGTATVQSDGNLTGTYNQPWVVRYGNYLVVINQGTSTYSATLPAGYGQAQDLVTKNFYNLGSSVSVAAGQYAIFSLSASNTELGGTTAPAIATAATLSSSIVTGTTVNLSTLATANNSDEESSLTYTWSLSGNPESPVTFSANGTNAAKNTTATFDAAGTYNLTVVATDSTNGLSATSTAVVTVKQTFSSVAVTPAAITLVDGQTYRFEPGAYDQFGAPMLTPQAFTWSLSSGTGTLNALGYFTAPTSGLAESDVIKVSAGGFSATATVTLQAPVGIFSNAQDIGSPALTGSSSFAGSTYTITAGGNDIWSTSDQFHFTYVPITGDGTITARVVTEQDTQVWTKAGVMFRNTLDAASANAIALMTPTTTNGAAFDYRSTSGGGSSDAGQLTGIAPPYWVRVTRAGSTFSAYSSQDGVAWTQLGTTLTISMNPTVYVGLALSSVKTTSLNTTTFDNVSITQPKNVLYTTDVDIGGATPFGTYAETGSLTVASGTSSLSGTATMTAGGTDIWNTSDGFHFAYLPISGNATLTARVVSVPTTTNNAKAGVLIRNSLDPASVEACTVLSPNGTLHFGRRATYGASSVETNVTGKSYPYWVRLVRTGNSFTAFYSPDGLTWTQDGTAQTVTMNTTVYAGLATCSVDNNGTPTTAVYDNISLTAAIDAAPTIATAAAAANSSITGTSTTLSVLGADSDGGGESNLTYTWTLLGDPAVPVIFSANGTNAAKSTTVTFSASGTYYFDVTITDAGGDAVTSGIVSIIVNLGAPTNLAAVPGTNQVTLNWTASTFASGYSVLRSTTSGNGYTTVASGVTATTYTDTGLTSGTTYYYVVTATDPLGDSATSTELELITAAATIAGFTPAGDQVTLNQNGVLSLDDSSGTYASSVMRASGLALFGGLGFSVGSTSNEPANFLLKASGAGNTNDNFSPLVLGSGPFFGKIIANASSNTAITFSSLSRTAGTQLNFAHSSNSGLGVGPNTIASATINSSNVIFTTPPTSLLVGGNGATGTTSVNVLPFAFINNELATYDTTNGLRPLSSSESTTMLTDGAVTTTNVKVSAAKTITTGATVNSLYLTSGGSINGTGTLKVTSGAMVADQTFNLGTTTAGTLAFGTAEGQISVANIRILTIGDVITGSGGLTIGLEDYNNTTAELILAAANTYTGVTTISGNNAALQMRLTNSLALQNTTVDYNNYGASLAFGNGGTTGLGAYTFGGLKGAQNLALVNNNTTSGAVALTLGGDGDSTTYAGVLSGAGSLIKTGTGALTLTGTNTYTGTTSVNQGILLINGSTAATSTLSVNSDGAVGGSGTVKGATTVMSGGIIAPGNGGFSTLTFSGGLNLSGGSIFNLDLGTTPMSDGIALTGAYTAPTSGLVTVNLNALAGFGMGTYTIMTGATSVSAASFAIGTAPSGYGYTFSASGTTLLLVVGPPIPLPAAPTALTAVDGDTQVTLNWTASTGAASYTVLRSTTSGSGYAIVATGITATTYTDISAIDGVPYYYTVQAIDAGGSSVDSTEISATATSQASTDTPTMPPWALVALAVLLIAIAQRSPLKTSPQ